MRIEVIGPGPSPVRDVLNPALRLCDTRPVDRVLRIQALASGRPVSVEVHLVSFRSWIATPPDEARRPIELEELERLRLVDALIFVCDLRPWTSHLATSVLESLQVDLSYVGRRLEQIPILFHIAEYPAEPSVPTLEEALAALSLPYSTLRYAKAGDEAAGLESLRKIISQTVSGADVSFVREDGALLAR